MSISSSSFQNMQQQPEENGKPQIATSDRESRQLISCKNITEVAYNLQTVLDAKQYSGSCWGRVYVYCPQSSQNNEFPG